jgi:hypothetical protein
MLRRRAITSGIALVVLLAAVAAAGSSAQGASSASPARADAICRAAHAATKTWSRRVPVVDSDEDMAAWETGVALRFGWTARDLRSAGEPALGAHFGRVASGHRAAATAYLSGSLARVNRANAQLRATSTRAMRAARGRGAPACASFVRDFRP